MQTPKVPESAFREMWHTEDRPYLFQRKVADLLAAGKRVILQAPTGSGKTRAALTAFLYNYVHNVSSAMPRKCLYAVPMRVLATQQWQVARESLGGPKSPKVTILTGEQRDDPRLCGDLVFLTIDQLLSSFLSMPYSLSHRQANLNAGALAGAYLVFDEFHLFDPGSTLPTTLDMLARLQGLGPVLVMTATMSTNMLDSLATELRAEVVTVPDTELVDIDSRWGARHPHTRTWHAAQSPLDAQTVIRHHRGRSLVICNQVDRARAIYDALRQRDHNVVLLHSRFLRDDRRRWEQQLQRQLAKGSHCDAIAVTTQVVEVGLDVSALSLHTDLAPAAALIQRAGRCARFPEEQGDVWVYDVPNTLPYAFRDSDVLAMQMKAAWSWLQQHDNQPMGFREEQALVDAVCGQADHSVLDGLRITRMQVRDKIDKALAGDVTAQTGVELVRDAESRRVLIHDQPDSLLRAPYAATGFSLPPSVLKGAFSKWQQRQPGGASWTVKRLVECAHPQGEEWTQLKWQDVMDVKQLGGAGIVCVHPCFASYSPLRGLLLQEGGEFRSFIDEGASQPSDLPVATYRLEPYEDHVRRLFESLQAGILAQFDGSAAVLERAANWSPGILTRALWLACALHDVGKLSHGWQAWASRYQKALGREAARPLAHTDYDQRNVEHQRIQQALGPRPAHAVEGAVAVVEMLFQALGGNESITQAALSAIARHHGPFSQEFSGFCLGPWSRASIEASLSGLPPEVRRHVDLARLALEGDPHREPFEWVVRPDHHHEWLAYALLVRSLRLADQQATALLSAQ